MSPHQCSSGASICCVHLCVELPSLSSLSSLKFVANFNESTWHVFCIQFHIFAELDETPGLSSMAWLTDLNGNQQPFSGEHL